MVTTNRARASISMWFAVALCFLVGCTSSSSESTRHQPPTSALKIGDEAKEFQLVSLGGGNVKLSEMASRGPVVLVVLRGYPGYQCPICMEQFSQYRSHRDELKALGVNVLFVYPGPADKLQENAAEFVKGKDYPDHFHILLDPDYTFTTTYGLRWDTPRETAYPSTFVIDKNRKVIFAKITANHMQQAEPKEVIEAIKKM